MPLNRVQLVREGTTVTSTPLLPELRLHLATEITPLWQKTQRWLDDNGVAPPYWAFAWVGGQAVARHLLDHPEIVRGKRVLDFASGSAMVGIAAARSGAARVVCSELDALAREAMRLNAELNEARIEISARDFVDDPCLDFDVVVAGDVCYEQPMAERVSRWLRALAAQREVLLGDPGRAYLLPREALVERARYEVATFADVEGRDVRTTGVFRVLP